VFANVGFNNIALAKSKCRDLSTDSCCQRLLSGANSQSSPEETEFVFSPLLIVSITGGIIALLVLIICIYFFCFKKNSRNKYQEFGNPDRSEETLKNVNSEVPPVPEKSPVSTPVSNLPDANIQNNTALIAKVEPKSAVPEILKSPIIETLSPRIAARSNPITNYPEGTREVKVVHAFKPTNDDELALCEGETLLLIKSFDDGWGLGSNPKRNEHGAFPLICVEIVDDDTGIMMPTTSTADVKKRVSSMAVSDIVRSSRRSKVPFSLYLSQLDEDK
jgi:hypothetical protein